MTVIQPTPFTSEGPQPLLREIPKGAPYPAEALGPLKGVVEAVQRATQAPLAIAAQSALSVASLAVQGHADVETLAGTAPTSLFCLTIAQSGERKSGCDKLIMGAVHDMEAGRWSDYREALEAWESTKRVWTAKRDRLTKDAAGSKPDKATAAEADLRNLGPEPPAPLSPKLTTCEPTLEGLFKLYLQSQPSLGLFSDEGGGFVGGHAMSSENRLKTVAGLSKLWGGDPLDRVRAGDGAATLFGRRLALHLMMQPVAARPFLADPVANGQGFLARFLVTDPPSAIGSRLADTGAHGADAQITAFSARLRQILEKPLPVKPDAPQELEPRRLAMSGDARAMLLGYYQATEAAQAPGGELEQVQAFASKSPEQAARIAGVLTLFKDLGSATVDARCMVDAIEIAHFHLDEAKRLAEAATISAETEQAEALRHWILESWQGIANSSGRDPLNILPSDVVQFGPGSMREAAQVKRLMQTLVAYGWLLALEKGAVVDGKARRLAYRVVRPEQ